MEKQLITSFIDKYALGSNTKSVKVTTKDKVTSCNFVTENGNVLGSITMSNSELPDGEIGIFDTSQLVKLLSAIDSNVTVTYNITNKKIHALDLKDSLTKATFMLADLSIINEPPLLKYVPDMGVSIKLTKTIIDGFIKSKNALSESENFAVIGNGDKISLVINYSQHNTTRISIETEADIIKPLTEPICFSSVLLKEILVANKDCENGVLEISAEGLAKVTMKSKNFESIYYLVKIEII